MAHIEVGRGPLWWRCPLQALLLKGLWARVDPLKDEIVFAGSTSKIGRALCILLARRGHTALASDEGEGA